MDVEKMAGSEGLYKTEKLRLVEKVSRSFVKHPKKLFGIVWGVLLLLSAIVFLKGWFEIAETTSYDWTVASSDDSQHEDALLNARDQLDSAKSDEEVPVRSKKADLTDVQFIFTWEDPDRKDEILNTQNVQRMCKVQAILTAHPDYPKFCGVSSPADAIGKDSDCLTTSYDLIARFYDNAEDRKNCPLLTQAQFGKKYLDLLNIASDYDKAFFYTRTFQEDNLKFTKIRSDVQLYGPLGKDSTPDGTTYKKVFDPLDSKDPQYKVYKTFLVDEFEKEMWKALGMEEKPFSSAYNTDGAVSLGGGLQVRFHTWLIRDQEFQRLIGSDQFLVSGAVLFVGVLMVAHTRSVFITVNGMMSIMISIPVALFIYNAILRVMYWSDIHIVVIFLVLGIGANDIFVFFDAFKQSKTTWGTLRGIPSQSVAAQKNFYGTGDGDDEVLIARLSYTLLRSSGTLLTTSFTTFAAFMATAVSPVVPVAAFGLYAALAILMNFVFTLILYPSFAIIFHKNFEGKPACCPCLRKGGESSEDDTPTATSDQLNDDETLDEQEQEKLHQLNTCEEKIFSRGYVPLLEVGPTVKNYRLYPVAIVSIIGLLVLFIIMGGYSFELETPKQRDEPFSAGHMFYGFLDSFANDFTGGSDYMGVEVTFGIKGIDRQDFSQFDPNGNRGVAVFDENFALAPSSSQKYVLEVCQGLEELSCIPEGKTEALEGCLPETKAVIKVECTMKDFIAWHDTMYNESSLTVGDNNPTVWLDRFKSFSKATRIEENVGFIGNELKFYTFKYEATLKAFSPETIKSPVLEILDGFIDKVKEEAPTALKSVFHTSFDMTWTNSELGIVSGMYQGLAISIPVAYVVVLVATGNLILSGFVIITIVSIVACVLGGAYLLGWALGVGEAIAAVMVVGLSVDHSLILGSAYTHLAKEGIQSREKLFRLSSIQMGPTVLAGALTTAGSAGIMFFCQLNFFTKMATLLVLTMSYSLLYTFFLFLSLCLLMGPQGNTGNWVYYISKCLSMCKRGEKVDFSKKNSNSESVRNSGEY